MRRANFVKKDTGGGTARESGFLDVLEIRRLVDGRPVSATQVFHP